MGYGIGANALIGGSRRGFILQPLSVQAQTAHYRGGRPVAGAQRRLKPIAEEGSAQR